MIAFNVSPVAMFPDMLFAPTEVSSVHAEISGPNTWIHGSMVGDNVDDRE